MSLYWVVITIYKERPRRVKSVLTGLVAGCYSGQAVSKKGDIHERDSLL